MKIAYFDCFSGASGDMILGALMDAGLAVETLKEALAGLNLSHYNLGVEKVVKKGVSGSKAIIDIEDEHHHRHLHHIETIINDSALDAQVKENSIRIFRRLAEAEAKVHNTSVEKIHFHEVGALDAIIDVVGSAAGLHALGVEKIYCSPLHVGTGTVECAHGVLPVPAPATTELIAGRPVYATGVKGELLTPTGAAILTTLASDFGPMPAMTIESIGYGAGTADIDIPNLLRVLVGSNTDAQQGFDAERTVVLETNIDDMNPQVYEHIMEKALDLGAKDIFLTPLQMKKNRPGTLITLLCAPEMLWRLADFLIRETRTIGLRWRIEDRIMARREIKTADTEYGPVQFKIARIGDEVVNVGPEYADCRRLAVEKNVPLKTVMEKLSARALEMR